MKTKMSKDGREESVDDLALLLAVLPSHLRAALEQDSEVDSLVEVVLDLGRLPEARYPTRANYFKGFEVSEADIRTVVEKVGDFTADNRAGIERTLHRISAIRNRRGDVIGLTCRVGRAITGTVDIIRDVIESGDSLLLLGPPGVGKTTLLREAARVLADDLEKRVIVVDTSNEIAGDGDVPHPGIGHARRMQVPSPDRQHQVMIEAVENHMPEVIVIDEIGTELESSAARTIAERGVQLVATAHGITLENLLMNPTLCDLVGGVQAVTLSDEEARRRGTRKTVLERKAPPTFDTLVEIQERNRLAVYSDLARVVDRYLVGLPLRPEVRVREEDGQVRIESGEREDDQVPLPFSDNEESDELGPRLYQRGGLSRTIRIYPAGISRTRLERAIRELGIAVRIADRPMHADVIVSLKGQQKRQPKHLRAAVDEGVDFYTIRNNSVVQIKSFLREYLNRKGVSQPPPQEKVEAAVMHAEDAVVQVQRSGEPVELLPLNSYLRRIQHEVIQGHGLRSQSTGQPPFRRVVVFPDA